MTLSKLLSAFRKPNPPTIPLPPTVDLEPLKQEVRDWMVSSQTKFAEQAEELQERSEAQQEALDAALERLAKAEKRIQTAASTQGSAEPLALSMAFIQGFQFAMSDGGQMLRQEAINEGTEIALKRLDTVVMERAEKLGSATPRTVLDLQKKMEEFTQRVTDPSTSPSDKQKYSHFLQALEWALYANPVPPHQV